MTDDAFLDTLERAAFGYFVEPAGPGIGLIADTSRHNAPVSIAVVGFALSAYVIGVERGWMTRDDALERTLTALRFFRDSDQSGAADATGYKGFYYHFLDRHTGRRVWGSEVSMIDTGFLLAGALVASRYFASDTPAEIELRAIADALYRRVDWQWAQGGEATLRQGWKPECGFLHYGWDGYSEAILLYVLATASPTRPADAVCYDAWTTTYQWENLYGHDVLYAGPMFIHQFSHAWIDFRGIRDRFMREKGSDYFENTRRAVSVQREYARRNPFEFEGYDDDCWGLSAGDGPGDGRVEGPYGRLRVFGYAARGVPHGPDDGTLSGSAAVASLPFAPDLALPAMRNMQRRYPEILRDNRYASGFNPGLRQPDGTAWVSPGTYGLDQGIVAMMIENHRSGLIWSLMRECRWIRDGLARTGFRGGWL